MSILTRQTKVELKDSNIALLGSDLELKVRQHAGDSEPAWSGVGQKEGVKIWRVEKFKLVEWPRPDEPYRAHDRYGLFFDGDSYIVLHTYKEPDSADRLLHDVHFWLGKESTQDEAGTAAYKTVELDDHLQGGAVQYREAQGHESDRFLALFPHFLVVKGGVSTGFHHPGAIFPSKARKIYRMWTIRGKLNLKSSGAKEQKQLITYELSFEGLTIEQGGVYVYDDSDHIYVYNTKSSSAWDRYKVGEYVMSMGYCRTVGFNGYAVFDEGTKGDTEFLKLVGVDSVSPAHSRVYEEAFGPPATLYRLKEVVPQLDLEPISLARSELKSDGMYILDDYANAHHPVVYVWVGNGVTLNARFALTHGETYLREKKEKLSRKGQHVSLSVAVVRIKEGQETPPFLKAFEAAQ